MTEPLTTGRLIAVGTVTGAALAYQVILTRLLSAVLAYHFSFLAVSLSLLGTGAGAMVVYLRSDWFGGAVGGHLAKWSLVFAATMLAVPIFVAAIDLNATGLFQWLVAFSGVCSVAALPPIASGIVVALVLSRYAENIGSAYAADLVGAGVGALIAVPLMWLFPAPLLMVGLVFPVVAAARIFSVGSRGNWAAAICALAAGVLAMSPWVPILYLDPGYQVPADAVIAERWTPLSRVMGVYKPGSEDFALVLYDRVYAPMPIARDGKPPTLETLQTRAQSIGFEFVGPGHTLIIGGGGGRDIYTALLHGQKQIDVIELNDGIRGVVDEDFGYLSGSPYSLPNVHTVVGDGRSVLAGRDTRYDQIHLGFTDTLSANAAQGFSLLENNLYTIEAFQEYFGHLKPGGILNVSRLYKFVGDEVLRLTVLALAALEERGVRRPRDHVFVVLGDELGGERMGTVLVRLEPYTEEEVVQLRHLARRNEVDVVLTPRDAGAGEWRELAEAKSIDAFCSGYELDVCPPTDDRPFFFNMKRLRAVSDRPTEYWRGRSPFPLLILLRTLAILGVMSLVFLVLPLALRRGQTPSAWSLAFFVLIGLGYILVELVLIQHFVLFLGFPTYALSVVLAGLLTFSGLGSVLSNRWTSDRALERAMLGAVVLLLAGAFFLQPLLQVLIGFPLSARIVIALILLAPVGLLLGCAMPLGLRRLEAAHPGGVAFAWGVNGVSSVFASVLGVVIALQYGFAIAGVCAALCYLGAYGHAALSR